MFGITNVLVDVSSRIFNDIFTFSKTKGILQCYEFLSCYFVIFSG